MRQAGPTNRSTRPPTGGLSFALRPCAKRLLESRQHDLSPGAAALDEGVRPLEIARVDRTQHIRQGGSDRACINEPGDLVQNLMLPLHVGGLERGPGEHGFPMDRYALPFEPQNVE